MESIAACAATGIFSRENNAFSCRRSCETSSARRGGRIAVRDSSGASAAPAMFSQSKVDDLAGGGEFAKPRRIFEFAQ